MGFGLVRLIIGIVLVVVLIWLLVKVIKLVEAYTAKLKK
jgi:flagellar biogenesis protein FliO